LKILNSPLFKFFINFHKPSNDIHSNEQSGLNQSLLSLIEAIGVRSAVNMTVVIVVGVILAIVAVVVLSDSQAAFIISELLCLLLSEIYLSTLNLHVEGCCGSR